jgi:hypothetical protein
MIELYTGIICACLSSVKAFCKHHFPTVLEGGDNEPPTVSPRNQVMNNAPVYTDLTTSTGAQSEARSDIWHVHNVPLKEHPSYNLRHTEESSQDRSAAFAVSVQQPKDVYISLV